MKTIITAAVAAVLCGCETAPVREVVWIKNDGASVEDFRRDRITCVEYGYQKYGGSRDFLTELFVAEDAKKCLKSLGYHEGTRAEAEAKGLTIE